MARRINQDEYGQSRPKLGPEHLPPGANAMVVTIEQVEPDVMFQERKRIVLTYSEFPDLAYWLNVTGVKSLIERLGDDVDRWVGQRVPLVKATTQNPQTKQAATVLWIAPVEDWETILNTRSPRRTSVPATPAPRGRPAASPAKRRK